ncbi:MAG: cold shock domain-containing protein [Pseudomonadota bacterium]
MSDSNSPKDDAVKVRGTIKWFDQVKGYGFITNEKGGGDVLLHSTCLKQSGQSYVPEGASITCEAVEGEKGLQATKILALDSTTIKASPRPILSSEETDPVIQAAGDFVQAEVKWFSRAKGYGFLTRGPGTEDIFIHMEVVRQAGMHELTPGQRVRVSYGHGTKGLLAAALSAQREN